MIHNKFKINVQFTKKWDHAAPKWRSELQLLWLKILIYHKHNIMIGNIL